jgi:hypothetical protein
MDMDSRSVTLAEEKQVGRTATPSPRPSYEKETKADTDDSPTDREDDSITNAPALASEEDIKGQYPEGLRLAFIVVALLLSIFLVSFLCQSFRQQD